MLLAVLGDTPLQPLASRPISLSRLCDLPFTEFRPTTVCLRFLFRRLAVHTIDWAGRQAQCTTGTPVQEHGMHFFWGSDDRINRAYLHAEGAANTFGFNDGHRLVW